MPPTETINRQVMYNVLWHYFNVLVVDGTFNIRTIIADSSYLPVNPTWLYNMVVADPILAPARYRKDIFDCDDYVLHVKTTVSLFSANDPEIKRPLAVGSILTTRHAFNFGIANNHKLFILNTQSDNRTPVFPSSAEHCAELLDLSIQNHIQLIYL